MQVFTDIKVPKIDVSSALPYVREASTKVEQLAHFVLKNAQHYAQMCRSGGAGFVYSAGEGLKQKGAQLVFISKGASIKVEQLAQFVLQKGGYWAELGSALMGGAIRLTGEGLNQKATQLVVILKEGSSRVELFTQFVRQTGGHYTQVGRACAGEGICLVSAGLGVCAERINELATLLRKRASKYTGVVVGPLLGAVIAQCVRMGLGKRVPTRGPLYVSIFVATIVVVTVWAVRFFKDPHVQARVQSEGVLTTVAGALPLPTAKALYGSHVLSLADTEAFLTKPEFIKAQRVNREEIEKELEAFKGYNDLVSKKIDLKRPTGNTLDFINKECVPYLKTMLIKLVILGDKGLIEEFVTLMGFENRLTQLISKEDLRSIYSSGLRMALLMGKGDCAALLPRDELMLNIIDLIFAKDTMGIQDYLAQHRIEAGKPVIYGFKGDIVLDTLGFKPYQTSVLQAAVIMGDVSILETIRAVSAGSGAPINWYQKDEHGLCLFALAALSGSKSMWDYVKQHAKAAEAVLPRVESEEFLYLLYAAIKGRSTEIFEELARLLEGAHTFDLNHIYVDLYQKARAYQADKIAEYLSTKGDFRPSALGAYGITLMLESALVGQKSDDIEYWLEFWSLLKASDKVSSDKLIVAELMSNVPSEVRLKLFLTAKESVLDMTLLPTQLAKAIEYLSEETVLELLTKVNREWLEGALQEQGLLFKTLVCHPRYLEKILLRNVPDKDLYLACARVAIENKNHDSLQIALLHLSAEACLEPLPGSRDNLLLLSLNSLSPEIVGLVLEKSPHLHATQSAALKYKLACLTQYVQGKKDTATIELLLKGKALKSGLLPADDEQLALVSAGAVVMKSPQHSPMAAATEAGGWFSLMGL